MAEPEIEKLSRKIYKKHKKILDVLFDHRPSRKTEMRDVIEEVLRNEKGIILDVSNNTDIRFIPKKIDFAEFNKVGQNDDAGWKNTTRLLLFQFRNNKDSLFLSLYIGEGDSNIRHEIYAMAKKYPALFKAKGDIVPSGYKSIYSHSFLLKKDYDNFEINKITSRFMKKWIWFVENDMSEIIRCFSNEKWGD